MAMDARELSGGDLLARTLRQAGVTQAFALHGGHLEALLKGCVEQEIALLDTRHEAAAGHAADAYARATAQLGVCFVTAGPGAANVLPAVVNAQLDAVPVLFIIGAPPLREAETNPLQGGFDQIAAFRPTAKWVHRITNTERIPDITAMAIRHAMTGRRGAVVLELPIDILHMSIPEAAATKPAGLSTAPRPAPSAAETRDILALLDAAERPCIIVGGSAAQSGCDAPLQQFAEHVRVPVFANSKGLGLLPMDHPLSAGAPGGLAVLRATGQLLPDLVIVAGARFGMMLGGRSGSMVPDDAKVVHIYPDAAEIGRIRDADIAVAADCQSAFECLAAGAAGRKWDARESWIAIATGVQHAVADHYPHCETERGIHPFHAAKIVMDVAGPSAAFALDGGEAASWGGDAVRIDGPGRVNGHGYLGCLGIGPGFAIGLAKACPGRRIVHFTGDGGFGFHLQELDTMVRHGLPVVNVILNNEIWGMSLHGQQIMFGQNYSVISKLGGTNYASIAAGFGCHAERVTRFEALAPALDRAFACDGPALVEVMTDPEVAHPITALMLGQPGPGSNDVVIPYYENIPRA